jgi:hypothetical protein
MAKDLMASEIFLIGKSVEWASILMALPLLLERVGVALEGCMLLLPERVGAALDETSWKHTKAAEVKACTKLDQKGRENRLRRNA